MSGLPEVKKLGYCFSIPAELYTSELQLACDHLGLDYEGTDAELEQRLADWRAQVFRYAQAMFDDAVGPGCS